MRFILLLIIFNFTFVKNSSAAQCSVNNPCELGGYFVAPNYNCFQVANNPNDVICTCPNGQGRINTRCRVCDSINCGPNGICFERAILPGLFYFCGCSNGTGNYAIPGPCPGAIPSTATTITTTVTTTFLPISCLNGGKKDYSNTNIIYSGEYSGVYDSAKGTCSCRTGFIGRQCEISDGQEICRYVSCANGGVCNPVPTVNNGFDIQCWCLNGFSGTNCELIGKPGGCTSNLCQNGGICEEKILGSSCHAYCQCPAGYSGQFCETHYFTCTQSDLFTDSVNCKFGRYFQCVGTVPIIKSCPPGSRFDATTRQCDINAPCPF